MDDDTTLRVRPPLALRETIGKVAKERGVSYQRLVQHLIRQALRQHYQPKDSPEEHRIESRVQITREEKIEIRNLAKGCQPKLTPEEWAIDILKNYEHFLESNHGDEMGWCESKF